MVSWVTLALFELTGWWKGEGRQAIWDRAGEKRAKGPYHIPGTWQVCGGRAGAGGEGGAVNALFWKSVRACI